MNYSMDLLSKAAVKIEEIPPYEPMTEYNIFNVLKVNAKEVLMCRFLADLLNPEGAHGMGIFFLKSFLHDILKEYRMTDTLLAHTDVIREFIIDEERRIDIVIRNADFFIPIEVKIYAEEQKGQCYDYYCYKQTTLVYLTRFKNSPSEYSRKQKNGTEILPLETIHCVSWAYDISAWLNRLLPWINEPVKTNVMQYLDAIHVVANGEEQKLMEELTRTLQISPVYFKAGIELEKAVKSAKAELIRSVFEAFKQEMTAVARKYGLEPEREAWYHHYEKEAAKYYDSSTHVYPGLNYVVKRAKFQNENLQMWFRIEIADNLFAGFSLYDMSADKKGGGEKGCQVDHVEDAIQEAEQYLDRVVVRPANNWWIAWCYPNGRRQDGYYDNVPDFKHMNQCAIDLVNEERREEFVKKAVENFEKHLLKYLKNI